MKRSPDNPRWALAGLAVALLLLTLDIGLQASAARAPQDNDRTPEMAPLLRSATDRTNVATGQPAMGLNPGGEITTENPDLSSSTKTSSSPDRLVLAGSLITFTVTLTNTGTAAEDVRVTDELGPFYSFYSSSDFEESPEGVLTWRGSVADRKILTFVAQVADAPVGTFVLSNTATIDDGMSESFAIEDVRPPRVQRISIPIVTRGTPDPYEPNDTPEQAYGPLVSGQPYVAYFPQLEDLNDYYLIDVTRQHRVDVDLTVPPTLDLDLWIYDPGNRLIAGSSRSGLGQDESVRFKPELDGEHYIRVYRFAGVSKTQPYTLTATVGVAGH